MSIKKINPLYPEIFNAEINKLDGYDHLYELICHDECGRESLKLRITDQELDVLSLALYKNSAFHQLFEKEEVQCL